MKPEAEESANRLWYWIAQYGHTKQPEFIADLKAVLEHAFPEQPQPAEDPDEWVVQDRVPVRIGVDEYRYASWYKDDWRRVTESGNWSGKEYHNWTDRHGDALHVRCRRRDLPKVEPQQCAACDALAEPGTAGCKDCNEYATAICSPLPEPQKTMLRLWIDSDCNVHAGLKGDRDLELLYDHETRQFYTEEQP